MKNHLVEAIRLQTVSHDDPGLIDYAPFERFLAFLERTHPLVHSRLNATRVGGYSLLLHWSTAESAQLPVLFEAHYDVAPVEPETLKDWKQPPFSGVIVDQTLWGRGALDDKLSVIALFAALESLLSEGFQPSRDLYFAIGHDEEIGGNNGARNIAAILRDRGLRFGYMVGEGGMIVDDFPGLPDRTLAIIGLAQKSYMTLRLHARGKGGHSSVPPDDNALVRISRAAATLHDNPFEPHLVSPISDMFREMAPHVGGIGGFVMKNQGLTGGLLAWLMSQDEGTRPMVTTTTAVTVIDAGVKDNVIPQQASLTVNFRLLPGETPESIVEQVKAKIDDPSIDIEILRADEPPVLSDRQGVGYYTIANSIRAVIPAAIVVPGMVVGTTDTRHYQELVDNVYHFHPYHTHMSNLGGVHGTDERVDVAAIPQAVDIYRVLLQTAGSTGDSGS